MFPLGTLGAGSSLNAGGGAAGPSRSDLFGGESVVGRDWSVSTGGGGVGLNTMHIAIIAGAVLIGVLLWKKR